MGYLPDAISLAISSRAIRKFNTELHPGSFDVMMALLAEAHGNLFRSGAQRLSYLTGFSRTKVFLCLAALEESGMIERLNREDGFTVYRITRSGIGA